jgi:hypothetical protein
VLRPYFRPSSSTVSWEILQLFNGYVNIKMISHSLQESFNLQVSHPVVFYANECWLVRRNPTDTLFRFIPIFLEYLTIAEYMICSWPDAWKSTLNIHNNFPCIRSWTWQLDVVLQVIFKCNYLSNHKLEYKNILLRNVFVGKMGKLTGGWKKL